MKRGEEKKKMRRGMRGMRMLKRIKRKRKEGRWREGWGESTTVQHSVTTLVAVTLHICAVFLVLLENGVAIFSLPMESLPEISAP